MDVLHDIICYILCKVSSARVLKIPQLVDLLRQLNSLVSQSVHHIPAPKVPVKYSSLLLYL